MDWATFWAIFSQNHLVALLLLQDCVRAVVQEALKQLRTRDVSFDDNSVKFACAVASGQVKDKLAKSVSRRLSERDVF
jgi:hypothetical protein